MTTAQTETETDLAILQRRMEAAWRDLTAEEQRCRPDNQRSVARSEHAYDRYLTAMDAYMACAARVNRGMEQQREMERERAG